MKQEKVNAQEARTHQAPSATQASAQSFQAPTGPVQNQALKYRLYPTPEQASILAQIFGSRRWIYNHFLAEQQRRYREGEEHLSHFSMCAEITRLKQQPETEWLKESDSIALQQSADDLATAYKNFFNSIKGRRKGRKMELPRFKRRTNRQSYRTRGVKVLDGAVKLPKIKTPVSCVFHREIPPGAKIKSATISHTPSGKYFISILVETPIELKSMSTREVGIDLGLTHVAITSDGHKFNHPQEQIAKAKRLRKRRQRQLARKEKGSNNWNRKRVQMAKAYEREVNIRTNYYHNISNWLVSNYDAIYVEDLNVTGMLKNRCLSRAIHESSWSQLSRMIEYKCEWYGKTYYRISRWTPTSKTCNSCGHKEDRMPLGVREWTCSGCGTDHDRDINAARNILHVGQQDLYGRKITSPATGEGVVIPRALEKHVSQIERSGDRSPVDVGTEQAQTSS